MLGVAFDVREEITIYKLAGLRGILCQVDLGSAPARDDPMPDIKVLLCDRPGGHASERAVMSPGPSQSINDPLC